MYAPTLSDSPEEIRPGNSVDAHKMVHHCLQSVSHEMGPDSLEILVPMVQRRTSRHNHTPARVDDYYFENDT